MFPANYFGPTLSPTDDLLAAIAEQTNKIAANNIEVIGGFAAGEMTLVQGDSYSATNGKQFTIPRPANATYPADLTGWTVALQGTAKPDTFIGSGQVGTFSQAVTVTNPATSQEIVVDLPASLTSTLAPGCNGWTFKIVATSGSEVNTLLSGALSVIAI